MNKSGSFVWVFLILGLSSAVWADAPALPVIQDARTGVPVTLDQVATAFSDAQYVVLGEKHDTDVVQTAEAEIVAALVRAHGSSGSLGAFTLAWEFLNAADQAKINMDFAQFAAGKLAGPDFLLDSQGGQSNLSYIPVLETVAALKGVLQGVNLTREEKAPVVENGLSAAEASEPGVFPPGFALGGAGYLARFTDVMTASGHATDAQIANYFAAQCLTDDSMAYRLTQPETQGLPTEPLRILVTGDFHADYFDATVARVRLRAGLVGGAAAGSVRTIRIVDAADFSPADLAALRVDPTYGAVADYVYIVNSTP